VLLSLPIAWLLLPGAERQPGWPALDAFYIVGVFIALMLLGGPHGAPSWGLYGAVYLGVIGQNLLIWWCARLFVRLFARARDRAT
jgi:hypothetical protein